MLPITGFVVLSLALVGARQDGQAGIGALEGAEEALRGGNPRAALQLLERAEAAGLSPALGAGAALLRGLAHEELSDWEAARDALQAAREAGAGDEASLGLARVYLKVKDAPRARAALEALPAQVRARQPVLGLAATAAYLDGRLAEAEAGLLAAVREAPSAEAEHLLGVLLFDRGDRARALERFEAALRLDPGDYYSAVYRIRAFLELGRAEEALRACSESLGRYSGTVELDELRARSLLRLGRAAEAAETFRAVLERRPEAAEALFGLAAAQRKLGRIDESREASRRFELAHRREEERLRALDRKVQKHLREPSNVDLAAELAVDHLGAGDLEAAERYAWKALSVDPLHRGARLALARACAGAGRYSLAALHYQRILRRNPGDEEARGELSRLVERHARREK